MKELDYLMRRFRRFPDAVVGNAFMHPDEPERGTIPAYRRLVDAHRSLLRDQGFLEFLRLHSGARCSPISDGGPLVLEIRGYDPEIALPLDPELDDGILPFASLVGGNTSTEFGLSCDLRPPGVYQRTDDGFPGPWERCWETFLDWLTGIVAGEFF